MTADTTAPHEEASSTAASPGRQKRLQSSKAPSVASSTTINDDLRRSKATHQFGQVQPRYLDVDRSTNYVRNRNEQLQRRRELEKRNSARAAERMQQSRASTELKQSHEQEYRKWLQDTNAEEHRVRNAAKEALQHRTPTSQAA